MTRYPDMSLHRFLYVKYVIDIQGGAEGVVKLLLDFRYTFPRYILVKGIDWVNFYSVIPKTFL